MKAIILAGGKGARLAPLTTILPKPLMPVGDIAILEVVIRQLAHYGFDEITLCVGFLAELIQAYCGDGSRFGVHLTYSREEQPLGTAGPISLVPDLSETFLVMNGDLLTSINYLEMLEFHRRQGVVATLAASPREVKIDLGVIESDENDCVTEYREKPSFPYWISTGIYFFEPAIMDQIPHNQRLDLPELICKLLEVKQKVACYKFSGHWLDIGHMVDYDAAVNMFASHRAEFLPET